MNIRIFLGIFLIINSAPLWSEEHQHSAHEHGAAHMVIVQEGKILQIELDSPAFNIVGFEHAPTDAHDQELLEKSSEQLLNGNALFSFPKEANCMLNHVELHSSLFEEDHEEAEEDGSEHHAEHSDIEVAWTFNCDSSSLISSVRVNLFSMFEHLDDLDIDFIMNSGQGAVELNPNATLVSF